MKRYWFILIIVLYASLASAQSTNITTLFHSDIKKAESFFQKLAYPNALEFFLRVAERDPSNKQAKDRIAECYVRLGNYTAAETWLESILTDPQVKAIDHFHYAQVLSVLGKYDEAMLAYRTYAQLEHTDTRGVGKVDFLRKLDFHLRDSNLYSVRHEWFNSDQSDFSPTYYKDGIVFVSARDRDLFIKRKSLSALHEKEALLNAFYVDRNYDSTQTPESQVKLFYNKNLNSPYHDGPVSFFDDGKRIAFTRNILRDRKPVVDSKGRVNLELYFARLNDDKQLEGVIPFEHNDQEYTVAHPWISNDGHVLYFSSNRPGGLGGADIYVCYKDGNKWDKPLNLGRPVNTPGDEFYPYLHKDSLFFFSSNGHGGFGGLDNFVSTKKGDIFEDPRNLSFPLNSSRDDFGLVIDKSGRNGIFSSDRAGGNGYDDIYSYSLNYFTLLGTVVERESGSLIPKANIIVSDSIGNRLDSTMSDDHGNFFLNLKFDKEYKIEAEKEGYTSLEKLEMSTRNVSVISDTLSIKIWENNLRAEGLVYSNETQQLLPGTHVVLEDFTLHKSDTITTGVDGRYRFEVVPNRQYRISALKPGFLTYAFNLNTHHLYKGDLKNDILLEEEFMEKFDVYFEFNKKDIRDEFIKDLNKIVKDMKRAPLSTIHIAAHADAQGTVEYNQKLSEARANEARQYLVARGIAPNRIEAIGFGEELVLNRCSDGVECTDEEHSKNRRAELKIQIKK